MSKEENINKIKSYIDDILGTKGIISSVSLWLYDKFLPTGDILVLTDKDTEEIIPSDTPSDIWDLIQEHAKKDNK